MQITKTLRIVESGRGPQLSRTIKNVVPLYMHYVKWHKHSGHVRRHCRINTIRFLNFSAYCRSWIVTGSKTHHVVISLSLLLSLRLTIVMNFFLRFNDCQEHSIKCLQNEKWVYVGNADPGINNFHTVCLILPKTQSGYFTRGRKIKTHQIPKCIIFQWHQNGILKMRASNQSHALT